ncbi:hypothetical protein C8F04DRAFT_217306 [Mycena alexandri]|uniref:Uncharacterized protein n=1 Tax=Mycena alexandri TaxID=1745969 RepID=A0AAD6TMQ2_9AGAR|nr:hypothetical protein C8F04DRAFT_217306 [Mycena alexandri]
MRGHVIFLASFAVLVARVAPQTSNVTTCTPTYQWSINSKNQTPCLVAAYLESVCDGPVEVNSIPAGTHYAGPTVTNATQLCLCSTVTYSLISACGGCQTRTFTTWTDWSANCPQVEVALFLQPIPSQVEVPDWAYLDVTKTDNIFNPILANANESLSNPQTTSSTPSTTSLSTASAPPSSASVNLPSSPPISANHKKSNAGIIAGSVVGGLFVLVAAGLAVLICLRRRRRGPEDSGHIPSSFSTSPAPMYEEGGRHAAGPLSISPFPYHKEPSDTETYRVPGSPVTSAVHTTDDTGSVSTPAVQILHRYTGSAEL